MHRQKEERILSSPFNKHKSLSCYLKKPVNLVKLTLMDVRIAFCPTTILVFSLSKFFPDTVNFDWHIYKLRQTIISKEHLISPHTLRVDIRQITGNCIGTRTKKGSKMKQNFFPYHIIEPLRRSRKVDTISFAMNIINSC